MTISVLLETELGSFTIAVDASKAPVTAANFLRYVDEGLLDDAEAYRIVTYENQNPQSVHKIEVVQWGYHTTDDRPAPFLPITHETTEMTGLSHKDMTVSMARFAVGSAASEFFICIGDQPELDFGGRRNPDGQGFAAFGQVVDGRDTAMKIFAEAETGAGNEYKKQPVKFKRVRRA